MTQQSHSQANILGYWRLRKDLTKTCTLMLQVLYSQQSKTRKYHVLWFGYILSKIHALETVSSAQCWEMGPWGSVEVLRALMNSLTPLWKGLAGMGLLSCSSAMWGHRICPPLFFHFHHEKTHKTPVSCSTVGTMSNKFLFLTNHPISGILF